MSVSPPSARPEEVGHSFPDHTTLPLAELGLGHHQHTMDSYLLNEQQLDSTIYHNKGHLVASQNVNFLLIEPKAFSLLPHLENLKKKILFSLLAL